MTDWNNTSLSHCSIKYPHLTTASVASSGPVQATLDFYQYLDVVDESLSMNVLDS